MTRRELTENDMSILWGDTAENARILPFIETEDAQIISYGHRDPVQFVEEVYSYDLDVAAKYAEKHDVSEVTHTYAVQTEDSDPDGDWYIRWGQDADTEGSFPVTIILR